MVSIRILDLENDLLEMVVLKIKKPKCYAFFGILLVSTQLGGWAL